jgi:type IV secretory pathway TraG/TraD family ATPase VirD4
MAKLGGLIVSGLMTWMFGPVLASLFGLFGSWWWVGFLLPFLISYSITASVLDAAFSGITRGIFSAAMLRPVKGFMAEGLIWALCAWIVWQILALLMAMFPAQAWWIIGQLVKTGFPPWLIYFWWVAGISYGWLGVAKIIIGRATRPIRRLMHSLTFGMGGSSRFHGMLEEWANPWKPGMLLLGTSLHTRGWKVGVKDDRHFITMATSRSGKGRSGIIPNLLTWPGSALVIDPKGQNAAVTMRARRKLGQSIFVVDPFHELEKVGIDPRTRFRFNPLAELRPDDLDVVEQIGRIADALVMPDPRSSAFWINSARSFLAGLIAHVLTAHMPDEERTLGTMRRLLLTIGRDDSPTLGLMRKNEAAGGLAMTAAAQIDQGGEESTGDILSTAMEQTKWLDSLAMREALGASEFSLMDLRSKTSTVYLVLPPQYLDEHGRFLRLFVNLSLSVASQGRKPKHSILFVLDEFYALGPMRELAKSAGLLAGFGLKLWPIVQNLGQIKELYPDNFETFLGNAGMWQVFAVNDETTARYLSERLGHHVAWRKVRAPTGGFEWQPAGATWLRTSVEFAQESSRESGNEIIFQEGGTAFLLRRSPYDKMFKPEEYDQDPFEAPLTGLQAIGGIWGIPAWLDKNRENLISVPFEVVEEWSYRRGERKKAAAARASVDQRKEP